MATTGRVGAAVVDLAEWLSAFASEPLRPRFVNALFLALYGYRRFSLQKLLSQQMGSLANAANIKHGQ
jgi:hypothetical protein